MNKLLKILVLLSAIAFVFAGVRWLITPSVMSSSFGMTMDQGLGLSSQIGFMASFFLSLGACMLLALITGRRSWYYPAMLLLGVTAIGRILAWLLHDATVALTFVGVEVFVMSILLLASRRLAQRD